MPVRGADEQFVFQHVAQPAQGMADGRLTQADFITGSSDAALLHHRVEDNQQIEIEGAPVHFEQLPG
jgi:hypothetical protein